jgi:hypothetical protein
MATIHEDLETTASQILARLTTLQTTHGATLTSIRERSLAPVWVSDTLPRTFAGISVDPETWALVSQIERLVPEIDHYFRSAREALSGAAGRPLDSLATAVSAHLSTPQRIEAAMANISANTTSLTARMLAKGVSFTWASLPLK